MPHQVADKHLDGVILVPVVMLAGIASRFFLSQSAFFRRLRESHILTIHAQHTAAIYSALEAAQGAVNILFVADFNSNSYMMRCQGYPPVLT